MRFDRSRGKIVANRSEVDIANRGVQIERQSSAHERVTRLDMSDRQDSVLLNLRQTHAALSGYVAILGELINPLDDETGPLFPATPQFVGRVTTNLAQSAEAFREALLAGAEAGELLAPGEVLPDATPRVRESVVREGEVRVVVERPVNVRPVPAN